jgi:hypothetical protein
LAEPFHRKNPGAKVTPKIDSDEPQNELQDFQNSNDDYTKVKDENEDVSRRAKEEKKDKKQQDKSAENEFPPRKTNFSHTLRQSLPSGDDRTVDESGPGTLLSCDVFVLGTQLTEFQACIDNLMAVGELPLLPE